jgi:hypothetical protein
MSYLVGYPSWLSTLDWGRNPNATGAINALKCTHQEAIQTSMGEAERVGLDSGPLWEFGRICRELYATDPQKFFPPGEHITWPACLGTSRATLPPDCRESLHLGETILMRLNARLNIQTTQAPALIRHQQEPEISKAEFARISGLHPGTVSRNAAHPGYALTASHAEEIKQQREGKSSAIKRPLKTWFCRGCGDTIITRNGSSPICGKCTPSPGFDEA